MPNTDTVVSRRETSLAGAEARAEQSERPDFYRLPKARESDRFFGFKRTFYYEGEKRGYWKLARIRDRGKLRGVTLVPYDAVSAHVRSQMEAK